MEGILPLVVIGLYLAVVMYIGIFAFRKGKSTGEDFFVASRSVGSIVFFLALFATNMTSVAILGSSGLAFKRGIGIYGMMAAVSCLVIPLSLFFIGTRLWGIGKRMGHMTQVAFFRDRWECSSIGTLIFVLSAIMLLPYLIVSIIGGGTILETLSQHLVPYWAGGAIVAIVVMVNVFFGGMRGAVWVNVFQTILFLLFGVVAFCVIGAHLPGAEKPGATMMDGFREAVGEIIKDPKSPRFALMTRDRIPFLEFLSYCFIPLSSIMFPHMAIMCFTAKKVTAFKKTVILYPICITAIWLPCVFLGALGPGLPKVSSAVIATTDEIRPWVKGETTVEPGLAKALANAKEDPKAPVLYAKVKSHEIKDPTVFAEELAKINDKAVTAAKVAVNANPKNTTDSVLLHMLYYYSPWWLAGILAAGIISAVMGSDCHQILAMSTMFTRDVFDYYGGKKKFGEKGSVFFGRFFIVAANSVAYVIALTKPPIFDLAVRYAFSGFASMAPIMLAALFWKRSTKYGALAATLWIGACLATQLVIEQNHKTPQVLWQIGGTTAAASPRPAGPMTLAAASNPVAATSAAMIPALAGATQAAPQNTGIVVLAIRPGGLNILGFMPVVPMVIGSMLMMIVFSLLSKPPSKATIDKYFNAEQSSRPDETVPALQKS